MFEEFNFWTFKLHGNPLDHPEKIDSDLEDQSETDGEGENLKPQVHYQEWWILIFSIFYRIKKNMTKWSIGSV
jgi:hypothetical protein